MIANPDTPGIDGVPPTQPSRVMETYAIVSKEKKKKINAEVKAVLIILTRIDNDIYSIIDACSNAMEMWKVETRSQAATRNKGKEVANTPSPTYDLEPKVVSDEETTPRDKEIEKVMALISMSFKKIYKPTNNNLRTSSNTRNKNIIDTSKSDRRTGYVARECKKAKRVHDSAYHKEKMFLYKQEEDVIQLSAQKIDLRDDTDDELEDQELEAHYMHMAKIQEVISDATDNSRPIFDIEPLEKVHNTDDNYDVFKDERQHPEQPKFINDTYVMEKDDRNISPD
ncbi:hypothetical protein Tco_1378526 [Tanacetum coccineum]